MSNVTSGERMPKYLAGFSLFGRRHNMSKPGTLLFAVMLLVGVLASQPGFAQAPPTLMLQLTTGAPCLRIGGACSNNCTILFTTNLSNGWHYLANFHATNNPALFSDTNHALVSNVFYRAFIQQVPSNVIPTTNMVWISPGTFRMGSPTNEALRNGDETQHMVTFTYGFFMSQFPVTQGEYLALAGNNPSYFNTNHGYPLNLLRPVEEVSWDEASNYCTLLTQQERASGRLPTNWTYRLPTESEWEYACRAGTTTAFYFGNQLRSGMANFDGQFEYDSNFGTMTNPRGIYLQQTTTVGSYEANIWGLFDMCGNVYQWCQDWYDAYPLGSVTNPQGPATDSGFGRVLRNNGWTAAGQYCRSAQRGNYDPTGSFANVGFRIVLAPL